MELITFELPSHKNYQVSISRDELLKLFPDSLLATALQDKEAKVIPILSPAVTPNILNLLAQMISTGYIPDAIPRKDDLVSASRYLLIDILRVVADLQYDYFHLIYPEINLLDISSLPDKLIYDMIMTFAIHEHYSILGEYLLEHTEWNEERNISYFLSAVEYGEVRLAQLFIRRGIDSNQSNPKYEDEEDDIRENALGLAIYNNDIPMVQFLLQDERIAISDTFISKAIENRSLTILSSLVNSTRCNIHMDDRIHVLLNSLTIPGALRILVNSKKFDITIDDGATYKHLTDLAYNGHLDEARGRLIYLTRLHKCYLDYNLRAYVITYIIHDRNFDIISSMFMHDINPIWLDLIDSAKQNAESNAMIYEEAHALANAVSLIKFLRIATNEELQIASESKTWSIDDSALIRKAITRDRSGVLQSAQNRLYSYTYLLIVKYGQPRSYERYIGVPASALLTPEAQEILELGRANKQQEAYNKALTYYKSFCS